MSPPSPSEVASFISIIPSGPSDFTTPAPDSEVSTTTTAANVGATNTATPAPTAGTDSSVTPIASPANSAKSSSRTVASAASQTSGSFVTSISSKNTNPALSISSTLSPGSPLGVSESPTDATSPISSPTTFATSTTSNGPAAGSPDSTATSAADSRTGSCSGLSCSSDLKAAVAVPVTLVGLALIIIFIIFARRRRRKNGEGNSGPKQKWTRHLRMFSFDAELLVGGNHSNSSRSWLSRSRDPSVRSGDASIRSQPSVRSIDQAAPAYRDALSDPRPMSQTGRPDSRATAPPPYVAAFSRNSNREETRSPASPTSALGSNPFRSEPSSPVDGHQSPFADPPETSRPILSRGSSRYQSVRGDDTFSQISTVASDAGSIREAQVAQNFSGARRN